MTCREFKHDAASLTLSELTQSEDRRLLGHAEDCDACGAWLRKQRTLAVSMQTLQARTAGLEAGADVERTLLQAFRQDTHRGKDPVFRAVKERSGSVRPAVTSASTPNVALRLSRIFEVGSYVALAAALLVGIFLGVRLLQHSSRQTAAETSNEAHTVAPPAQQPAAVTQKVAAVPEPQAPRQEPLRVAQHRTRGVTPAVHNAEARNTAAEDSQNLEDAGYTALMFCDPLSCASDTEVVRVQLPANGQSSQPQMADLVVGYDGVVRAVRIVN